MIMCYMGVKMSKIPYMKMTIIFTLIIILLAMLSTYYNFAPMASLTIAFATYFILITNIWENNKNLKKQNIENRKNIYFH